MPTYVYACSACDSQYEVEQRITEDALEECRCGSKGTIKRVIQPVGVMFKGSGFHINDYAPKSTGDSESAPKVAVESSGVPAPLPAASPTTPAGPSEPGTA